MKGFWKKIKYYVVATVAAGAIFGGLTMTGVIKIGKPLEGEVIRCATGDVGTGDENERKVAFKMKDEGCQEIILLGDLIYDDGIKSPDDPKFKTHFWDHYGKFDRLILTQGNHDAYSSTEGIEAWITLSARYPSIIYPSHFFLYQTGDWCIFSWFSEPVERSENNKFSQSQSEFAKNLDLSTCKVKVSIAHHPYRSQGEHGNAKRKVEEFYEKFILGKFDYALAGHDHNLSYEGQSRGTQLYVSGAGSKLRTCTRGKNKTCWEKLGFLKFVGNDKPQWVFVD